MNDQIEQAAKEIVEQFRLAVFTSVKKFKAEEIAAIISRHLSSVQEWVKVTPETMPKDEDEVITCNNFRARRTASWSEGDWHFEQGTLTEMNQRRALLRFLPLTITHWQPLPAPPSASTQHE